MARLEDIVVDENFIQQSSKGKSDYTAERDKLLEDITLDDIIENIHK